MENDAGRSGRMQAIAVGGLAAAVLDALDALVAYRLAFGMSPLAIYQFVASGLLGQEAYAGGVPAALLGLLVHSSSPSPRPRCSCSRASDSPDSPGGGAVGLGYGVLVFVVMGFGVIPLSRIPPSTPTVPLLLNGVISHAVLVGLPIALAARRYLGRPPSPVLSAATA
jgi:hypothetical protein